MFSVNVYLFLNVDHNLSYSLPHFDRLEPIDTISPNLALLSQRHLRI